jgi:hypothetical protein
MIVSQVVLFEESQLVQYKLIDTSALKYPSQQDAAGSRRHIDHKTP